MSEHVFYMLCTGVVAGVFGFLVWPWVFEKMNPNSYSKKPKKVSKMMDLETAKPLPLPPIPTATRVFPSTGTTPRPSPPRLKVNHTYDTRKEEQRASYDRTADRRRREEDDVETSNAWLANPYGTTAATLSVGGDDDDSRRVAPTPAPAPCYHSYSPAPEPAPSYSCPAPSPSYSSSDYSSSSSSDSYSSSSSSDW